MDENTDLKTEDAAATISLAEEINELLDDSLSEVIGEVEIPEESDQTVESPLEDSETGPAVDTSIPVVEKATKPEPVASDEISQLRAQIESLTGLVSQLSEKTVATPAAKVEDSSLDKLLSEFDFDEVMESKEAFTGFMKSLVSSVVKSTEDRMNSFVPETVGRHLSMNEVRDNFYKANKELEAVKPYVAMVANTVASENPEWSVQEILQEAAVRVKTSLSLNSVAPVVDTPSSNNKPTLPGGTNTVRKPAAQVSKLQNEIDELLND